jgi:phytoene dehydrogenase-like protein
MNWDAIVVGGGHNGLVCAAYLARAGQRVLVLERREVVGGMADTSELLPGVRVPTLAHTVGRLRPSVVRELGLADHGLALVQPEVRLFAPQPDGRGLTLWGVVERTARDLAAGGLVGRADAEAYPTADAEFRALGAALSVLMSQAPPDLASPTLVDAVAGLKLGLLARSRADSGPGGLLRVLPMAAADLVGEWFEGDQLRAAIAARGVLYTGLGPLMPGTAQVLLADSAGNDGGLAGQTVFARGGPGAVGDALVAAARSMGVEIRTGAEVAAIRHRDDVVTGVTLVGGEEIDAAVVVSGADPKTTLLHLLAPETVGPRLSWRAGNIRSTGATAKVNLALTDLPRFTSTPDAPEAASEARLRGRIVIAPSMSALLAATTGIKYGRLPVEPYLEATIPTLVDPGLLGERRRGRARGVKHVMSVIVQSVPADSARDAVGELVLRTLERYAPGISHLIVEQQVITPLDIERDYGASGGHPMHAEIALDQWFAWRPLHGYGRYRMPLPGLYLCASGAHPGGGVTGAPGQLAAHEILADVAG